MDDFIAVASMDETPRVAVLGGGRWRRNLVRAIDRLGVLKRRHGSVAKDHGRDGPLVPRCMGGGLSGASVRAGVRRIATLAFTRANLTRQASWPGRASWS